MAAKKKTESEITEAVEEVKEAESAVTLEEPKEEVTVAEEAPKKTTRKSTKKKVEEPQQEEEVKPEPEVEVVGTFAVEVKEQPKVEKCDSTFLIQITSPSGSYVFAGPGLDKAKGRILPRGTKVNVTEVNGNWGKIGEGRWVLLSTAIKL